MIFFSQLYSTLSIKILVLFTFYCIFANSFNMYLFLFYNQKCSLILIFGCIVLLHCLLIYFNNYFNNKFQCVFIFLQKLFSIFVYVFLYFLSLRICTFTHVVEGKITNLIVSCKYFTIKSTTAGSSVIGDYINKFEIENPILHKNLLAKRDLLVFAYNQENFIEVNRLVRECFIKKIDYSWVYELYEFTRPLFDFDTKTRVVLFIFGICLKIYVRYGEDLFQNKFYEQFIYFWSSPDREIKNITFEDYIKKSLNGCEDQSVEMDFILLIGFIVWLIFFIVCLVFFIFKIKYLTKKL